MTTNYRKHCVVCGKAYTGQYIMCVWCWIECIDFDFEDGKEIEVQFKESELAVKQLLKKLGV